MLDQLLSGKVDFRRMKLTRGDKEFSWEDYIEQIMNKMNYNTFKLETTNMCASAAIYGLDGQLWASGGNWIELNKYHHEVTGLDGTVTKVLVDEFDLLKRAAEGEITPSEAGIRFGGKKYVYVTHNPKATST